MLTLTLTPGSCGTSTSASKEFLMKVYKENVSGYLPLASAPLGIALTAREVGLEARPRAGLHVSAVTRRASPHSSASTRPRPWTRTRPFLAPLIREQRGVSGF